MNEIVVTNRKSIKHAIINIITGIFFIKSYTLQFFPILVIHVTTCPYHKKYISDRYYFCSVTIAREKNKSHKILA